ncbi:hypothetical protein D3C75_1062480 [compost metagenome]
MLLVIACFGKFCEMLLDHVRPEFRRVGLASQRAAQGREFSDDLVNTGGRGLKQLVISYGTQILLGNT